MTTKEVKEIKMNVELSYYRRVKTGGGRKDKKKRSGVDVPLLVQVNWRKETTWRLLSGLYTGRKQASGPDEESRSARIFLGYS